MVERESCATFARLAAFGSRSALSSTRTSYPLFPHHLLLPDKHLSAALFHLRISGACVHLPISKNFRKRSRRHVCKNPSTDPSWRPSPFRPLPAPLPLGSTGDTQESAVLRPPVARIGAAAMQAEATGVEGAEEDDVEAVPPEGPGVVTPLQQRRPSRPLRSCLPRHRLLPQARTPLHLHFPNRCPVWTSQKNPRAAPNVPHNTR